MERRGATVVDMDWTLAACRGEDADLFFGPHHFERKRDREAREARAKAICARCPVRSPCRELALASGEDLGVWGGLGEVERRELLDAGRAQAAS